MATENNGLKKDKLTKEERILLINGLDALSASMARQSRAPKTDPEIAQILDKKVAQINNLRSRINYMELDL